MLHNSQNSLYDYLSNELYLTSLIILVITYLSKIYNKESEEKSVFSISYDIKMIKVWVLLKLQSIVFFYKTIVTMFQSLHKFFINNRIQYIEIKV